MSVTATEPLPGPGTSRWSLFLKELRRFVFIFLAASFFLFLALEAMPEDPVSLRVKNPDPARIAEGWERRFMAEGKRAQEMADLYGELGKE